jgi:hypothetical protein
MIFALLTLLSALSLASVAGWFSIIGITSIYAGATIPALVMGAVIEGAKLVTTSWLYRNWKIASIFIKLPLLFFTILIMLATSISVFGFLSKAHLEQGAATIDNGPKIERLDQQIAQEKSRIADDEKVIAQLDATVNSYLGKDNTDRSLSVRRAQDPQRNRLRKDIDQAQKRMDQFNDQRLPLVSEVRKLQLDVGPIRYIAELIYGVGNTDKNIESAVRIFTLIIVLTLDPLAITLLVAANDTLIRRKNEKEKIRKEISGQNDDISSSETGGMEINNQDSQVTEQDEPKDTTTESKYTDMGHENPEEVEIPLPISQEVVALVEDLEINNEEEITTLEVRSDNDGTTTHELSTLAIEDKENIGIHPQWQSMHTTNAEFPGTEVSGIRLENNTEPSNEKIEIRDEISINKDKEEENTPWAHQSATLRELIGSRPHFVPKKVIEPIIHVQSNELQKADKYPKALSWLNEFKRN